MRYITLICIFVNTYSYLCIFMQQLLRTTVFSRTKLRHTQTFFANLHIL